jgi:stage II sporulation protein AB (anti-sigma F factor)
MNKIELKFSSCIENEPFARTTIASFILPLNPSIDELSDIKTIVSEAVSNAIIHGYNYDSSKDVYLKAIITNNLLEICIQDYGVGIENVEEALKNRFTTRLDQERAGMGFSIMQSLSDSFNIRSQKDIGTRVTITKSFKKHYKEVN